MERGGIKPIETHRMPHGVTFGVSTPRMTGAILDGLTSRDADGLDLFVEVSMSPASGALKQKLTALALLMVALGSLVITGMLSRGSWLCGGM